jgi:hypothetical protein
MTAVGKSSVGKVEAPGFGGFYPPFPDIGLACRKAFPTVALREFALKIFMKPQGLHRTKLIHSGIHYLGVIDVDYIKGKGH